MRGYDQQPHTPVAWQRPSTHSEQIGSGGMLTSPGVLTTTPQSHDAQHWAHRPLSGQQRSPKGQAVSARWQAPLASQLSVVQALPSSQSFSVWHSRQPRCG